MDKLYTGNGDDGYTQTISDKHIPKSDIILELIGTVDEVSSCLGVAKTQTNNFRLKNDITSIQKELITVMCELAGGKIGVTQREIKNIENLIDKYQTTFCGFTICGENAESAFLDLARTVIRRAERIAVKTMEQGRVRNTMQIYLNRLSDLTYAMSQYEASNKA